MPIPSHLAAVPPRLTVPLRGRYHHPPPVTRAPPQPAVVGRPVAQGMPAYSQVAGVPSGGAVVGVPVPATAQPAPVPVDPAAVAQLRAMFPAFDAKTVEGVLRSERGDVEAAINALLTMGAV